MSINTTQPTASHTTRSTERFQQLLQLLGVVCVVVKQRIWDFLRILSYMRPVSTYIVDCEQFSIFRNFHNVCTFRRNKPGFCRKSCIVHGSVEALGQHSRHILYQKHVSHGLHYLCLARIHSLGEILTTKFPSPGPGPISCQETGHILHYLSM